MITTALGTVLAVNLAVAVHGQSCPIGSSPTVMRFSVQSAIQPPPWTGMQIHVPQFHGAPGQVLVGAEIRVTGTVSGSIQAENLSNTGPCNWYWCLGSIFQVHVPVPSQPILHLTVQECGTAPLSIFDGIPDYDGSSGVSIVVPRIQRHVSLSITDPAVLASEFTGSGVVTFSSDSADASEHYGCSNLEAIFVNNSLLNVTIDYSYCSPGSDFCVPHGLDVLACPCGNPQSPVGSIKGCNNSSGTGGAVLKSGGASSLSADRVEFTSSHETPTATTIFLQGDAVIDNGVVFGQGVLCIGGSLLRLYVKSASAGIASAPIASDASVSARSASLGDVIAPGTGRFYSAYYRDSTVLGGCPSTSTFNTTQGQSVTWVP